MEIGLSRLFGIEREERSIIGILLFQSVFLGIFYGVFNITAHAIFLSRFDETDMARAYIISGLAGSTLTYLYSTLQSRLRFSSFSVINLIFVLIVTLCLWFFLRANPEGWVVYAIFVMLGPLFILAMLGYWGTAGRLFTLRQGRRLFGIIDTGLILGMIVSSFSIPALLSFNIDTHNIILISALSLIVAVIVQLIIVRRHSTELGEKQQPEEEDKSGMKVFRESKYIRTMGIFIALSVLVVFFVQYSFMAVTKVRYPEENEMARFLGFFEGSMMVFTLLIKTFIFSYLIKNQGLKVTLAISPVLIGIFTIVAVIIGTTKGFVPGTSGFMIFFLILALSRLFSKALKDSVETPAFKVLYQTLGDKLRHSVQSTIDGTVNEIAALSSGLILTGLGALSFIKLIHFSWVLVVIIVLWVIFALKLYNEYRGSIRKTLEKTGRKGNGVKDRKEDMADSAGSYALYIDNNYYDIITDTGLHKDIAENELLLNLLTNKAGQSHNPDLLPLFRNVLSGGVAGGEITERIDNIVTVIESEMDGEGLGKSKDLVSTIEESNNRRMHLRAIMAGQAVPVITDLMRLIRDHDNEVKKETLYIAGKFRIKELLPEICECLDNNVTASDAYAVLKSFGEEAFPAMTGHFYRSSGNIMVRRLLTRLFAETGGQAATEFLLPCIWSINKSLRKEAVTGLIRCGFEAGDENRDRILQEIQDIIGLLTWNLSAQITLKENNDKKLYRSLEKDTDWWSEMLFDLLSLIYDKNSLDQIKENLGSGTVESVNFALEMLDIVIDDEIKPRLTALLDVVSLDEKVKNLFQFYPGNIPEYEDLVKDLVNKDYNHIGLWTKACAIRSLYDLPVPDESDFLVALLFGVNRLLREEACRYLQANYKDVYASCSYRIPKVYRMQLDELLSGKIMDRDLIFNKVETLSAVFPDLPEDLLLLPAEKMALVEQGNIDTIDPDNDFILYPVSFTEKDNSIKPVCNWHTAGIRIDTVSVAEDCLPCYLLEIKSIEDFVFYEPENSPRLVRFLDNTILEDE